MEKKSFVFYISWNEAIKEMSELQVRNFINNLCNYSEGKDVVLNDLTERIMWSQTQPLLDFNEGKRQKRIENGKKGGLSKGTNTNQNQVVLTPLNSTNQTQVDLTPLTEEGRGMKEEGRRMKEEGRGLKEEGRGMMDEGGKLIEEGGEMKEDVEGRLKLKGELGIKLKSIFKTIPNIIRLVDVNDLDKVERMDKYLFNLHYSTIVEYQSIKIN